MSLAKSNKTFRHLAQLNYYIVAKNFYKIDSLVLDKYLYYGTPCKNQLRLTSKLFIFLELFYLGLSILIFTNYHSLKILEFEMEKN